MRKWIFLIFILGACLVVVGCNEPKPDCTSVTELVAPDIFSPENKAVVDSLRPTLTWINPAACAPLGYRISLSTEPYLADELGGEVTSPNHTFTPSEDLQPATEYSWIVQPLIEFNVGPVSERSVFFTGPMCSGEGLLAPALMEPANGAVVNEVRPQLIWDYPADCLPTNYHIQLSTTLDLVDSPLNGGTTSPTTHWGPGDELVDCQRYYWRVKGVVDENKGPDSPVNTFRVDLTGSCPAETTGIIRGMVWHDLCGSPDMGPTPVAYPAGCVPAPEGGVMADGEYQWGEPGISGVVIRLAEGACPSATILRDAATDDEGNFVFYAVDPGTYCVMVDSLSEINSTILIPGGWTAPADGIEAGLVRQTVVLEAEENNNDSRFGWDYQFLPPWSEYGYISGVVWHDLCSASLANPAPDPLPEGCILDAWGIVHADGIRQEGEPGIPGIEVMIGAGDCPSFGTTSVITGPDGSYHFPPLPAGNYCIGIRPGEEGSNHDILMPGSWTLGGSGHEGMGIRTATISPGMTLVGNDFGWDYDNLPLTFLPYFEFKLNAFCRIGPDPVFDDVTSIPLGLFAFVEGRNALGDWLYVRLPGGNGVPQPDPPPAPMQTDLLCWVSADTGVLTGDLDLLPFIASLPTPTPVPDINGPTIKNISNSETPVYYPITRCGPTTLTISAKVEDDSGVKAVYLTYRYRTSRSTGAWRTVSMTITGGLYQATIDVGSEALADMSYLNGYLDYKISAEDRLGNQSESDTRSVQVLYCK